MRHFRTFVPLVAFLGFVSGTARAQGTGERSASEKRLFWKVASEKGEVYLLGSIHVGKADLYPLPAEIEDAFAKSAALVVEADMEKGDPAEIQRLVVTKGMYGEGDSIEKHLSKEAFEKLKEGLKKLGAPLEGVLQVKPWLLSLQLQMSAIQKLGYDASLGIDQHFLTAARKNKKSIIELESVEQQLDILAGFPDDLQEKSLLLTIAEQDQVKEQVEALFVAWSKGDSAGMIERTEKRIKEHPESKPVMEKMIDDRNVAMTKRIEGYLAEKGPHFVVVGSLHLVGDKGIVALLAQGKKYKIDQVAVTPTPKK
ncbi:MAG: GumN family [Planctomycetota bacterium]|nr:MAG: GumN family [Planctomycetota bacterium]